MKLIAYRITHAVKEQMFQFTNNKTSKSEEKQTFIIFFFFKS